jgi:isoleucyl-tRNA synthetase
MSQKFTEYKQLSLTQIADDILSFWDKENIFQKSVNTKDSNKPFIFFEGPPSANGLPGIHHVIGRTVKDIFARYKTMQGYQVKRKAGWDTHGLPVELGVEKELGITKEDIGTKISIDEYNKACKESVMRYTDIWNDLTKRIGYWVDMEHPYITYKPKYMETVWWLLKQLYDKGLMYKGYTIQPYSPKAGTGLSTHELNQPGCYKDVTDTTMTAQFKVTEESLKKLPLKHQTQDVYFLAWTTTPWTLPSNTALTVGKKIDYVLVKTFNQYTFKPIEVILAKALVSSQFGKKFKQVASIEEIDAYSREDKQIPYLVLDECKGADLLELRYEQLLPYAKPYQHPENAFRVIAGDFVTTEDGTGIVHTAPTFGQDDAMVAKKANPEVPPMLVLDTNGNPVPLVDLQGRFTEHMGPYAGRFVKNEYYNEGEAPDKSVDVELAIQLKIENKAFHVEKHQHNYPHCWRTDKPVLYYPLDSWFVKVTEKRDRLFELNNQINWKPKSTGEGRFGNWLQNANDWNLSRSRFWGIPLPIWRTEEGDEEILIGSVEELIQEMKKSVTKGFMDTILFDDFIIGDMSDSNYDKIDLHKNIVDKIILVSPSGKPMKREADLIDVWFDSGSMPVAQWHYPFENKELIDDKLERQADFIAEGVDQTRGWFYTLHAISGMVFDSVAYKNVVSNGLVLDKFGKKMSKRLGNAIDPFTTLDKYGPDAIRWYMIGNANPWDNLKFDLDGIDEVRRKFFGTLYNTYSFFALYANLDNFTYQEGDVPLKDRAEIDRWILSELHTLIKNVTEFYEDYEPTKATRAIQFFVTEHLSNWFVRLSRRRFWKGEYAQDKIAAYQTLYTCMLTVSKLAAPVAPFFMDRLYKDLMAVTSDKSEISVHLSDFPKYDKSYIDTVLEQKMEKAQLIASMTLSLRQKEKIKVRQPLQRIMIPVHNDAEREQIKAVQDLIKAEVNVKEIQLLDDASGILVKQIKPNFKVLGPRFGKEMKLIAGAVMQLSQEAIADFERNKSYTITVNDSDVVLQLDEVEITTKDIDGWLVANQDNTTVALDVTITDELKSEGIARELINRIQNHRKNSGFEVTDRINISFTENELIENAVNENKEYIKAETLADSIIFAKFIENGTEIVFDQVQAQMQITKV